MYAVVLSLINHCLMQSSDPPSQLRTLLKNKHAAYIHEYGQVHHMGTTLSKPLICVTEAS